MTQAKPSNPDLVEDYFIYPRMIDLAACLCETLAASNGPTPCFCGILPGNQAIHDYCGNGRNCGGQAWVRLVSAFPSTRFPAQDTTGDCSTELAFVLEVGVIRGGPVSDEKGNAPSVTEQLVAARLQMSDMAAMLKAIRCCMGTTQPVDDDDLQYTLGLYTPLLDGDCVGGTWQVTVSQAHALPSSNG